MFFTPVGPGTFGAKTFDLQQFLTIFEAALLFPMFQDAPAKGGIFEIRARDGKRWEGDTLGLGPFHFFLTWSVRKRAKVWENQFIYKDNSYKLFAVGVVANLIVNIS